VVDTNGKTPFSEAVLQEGVSFFAGISGEGRQFHVIIDKGMET
jgi:hypothetical protein